MLRPGYLSVMGRKAIRRLGKLTLCRSRQDSRAWCVAHAENLKDRLVSNDQEIWAETEHYAADVIDHARRRLDDLRIDFGGGANHLLLYFFTRLMKPQTVVETGVSLGWSSRAILFAMKKNGFGRLFSSDFPAFRVAQPEIYIGYLVEEDIRDRWQLFTKGDRKKPPENTVNG
jgi:predicted O-methyltransferase YrrM